MRKVGIVLILFFIIQILVSSQRDPNPLNGERNRQRPNRERERERGRGNKNSEENDRIADESLLSEEQEKALEESANRNRSKRSINQLQQQESENPQLTNQQLREFRQSKNHKPLIQLIFLLVGALILVLLIVLVKLFKKQQNPHLIPEIQPNPVIHIINPNLPMEQTLHASMNKPGSRSIQAIKEKYLMNNISSVNDLNGHECRNVQHQPNTPTFNYYNFSNTF